MKLALFTPVDRRSAIGRVSARVVAEWRATGHEVAVVATDLAVPEGVHEFGPGVLRWDEHGVVDAVLVADISVHQVGNSYAFHAGSLAWLPRLRGVVVLHDFYLTDLFLGWCAATGTDEAAVVTQWYGADAPELLDQARRTDRFLDLTAATVPMTEWLCAQALAVVTHSTWGLARVRAATLGPIAVAPMPYPLELAPSGRAWPRIGRDPKRLTLLSFGMINRNRQVDTVIDAIAADSTLRSRVTYHLLGPIRARNAYEYARRARERGVDLRVHGVADNRTLTDAVAAADIVVSLRSPATEAASASVLEAMQAGNPVVVSDAGSSADLPDDVVVKVAEGAAADAVAAAIRRLVDDPDGRSALGTAARSYVSAVHRVDRYAACIVDTCAAALPLAVHVDALDRAIEQLAAWGLVDERFDELALAPIAEFWNARDGSVEA